MVWSEFVNRDYDRLNANTGTKQAVYKRYKGKLHTVCAPYAHTEQGVLYLSEQAETLIKQDFLKADRSNGAHTERSRLWEGL